MVTRAMGWHFVMKRFPFLIVFLVLAANVIAATTPPDYPSGEVTW